MQASGILGVGRIRDTGQSHISRMIEYNVRCGTCDQHVRANIKLTTVQQKRVQHISEVNEKHCFSTLGFFYLLDLVFIIRKIPGTWPDPINVWGFARLVRAIVKLVSRFPALSAVRVFSRALTLAKGLALATGYLIIMIIACKRLQFLLCFPKNSPLFSFKRFLDMFFFQWSLPKISKSLLFSQNNIFTLVDLRRDD